MADLLSRALVSVRATYSKSEKRTAVFARSHQTALGTGWSFDVAEPCLTGAEHLLGVLCAEVIDLFSRLCQKRRHVIDHVEATAKAVLLDPLALLGVIGVAGTPRYSDIQVKVFVESGAQTSALQEAWADALLRAPLANTLRAATSVQFDLQLN